MTLVLDPKRMRTTLNKNLATSYGLTLVVGLPFPQPVLVRAARLREQVETLLPGRFRWYAPDHLHATVMAPLRGRYREEPPLQRNELPADLNSLVNALNNCFSALQPFSLELESLYLTPDGQVLALGSDPGQVRRRVAERLSTVPGLGRPEGLDNWHVTLGYLQTSAPFYVEPEHARCEADWIKLLTRSLGTVAVDRVWLAHYAERTLNRIVGKVPLFLGRLNALTYDGFLTTLGIGQGPPIGRS